jgi:hypothetical protein
MKADSPKSALETENHVPKADHIDPIKSCLIRDDLHMRVHLHSMGHLLTPALKEIRWTRAKRLLQWHAENGHENILFTDEKMFTIEEQYNNQYNEIYAQTSLEVRSEGAGGHHYSYVMVWRGGVPSGGDTSSYLQERCENWCPIVSSICAKRIVNPLNTTVFNGQKWVFQQNSAPVHTAKMTQEWLQGTFCPSSAPRIGPRGVQTSTPWTIKCGLV